MIIQKGRKTSRPQKFDLKILDNYNKNMKTAKQTKILSYFAIFETAEEGGYNVSFPDFPGCVTFGKTFEEAKEKAEEILKLWLEELASQKQLIPIKTNRPIIDEVQIAVRR